MTHFPSWMFLQESKFLQAVVLQAQSSARQQPASGSPLDTHILRPQLKPPVGSRDGRGAQQSVKLWVILMLFEDHSGSSQCLKMGLLAGLILEA